MRCPPSEVLLLLSWDEGFGEVGVGWARGAAFCPCNSLCSEWKSLQPFAREFRESSEDFGWEMRLPLRLQRLESQAWLALGHFGLHRATRLNTKCSFLNP